MISCRAVVEILSSQQELSFMKKMELKLHLLMCRHCGSYFSQLKVLNSQLKKFFGEVSKTDTKRVEKIENTVLEDLKNTNLNTTKKKFKKILFLCVANSARSQMAEGLAKNLLSSSIQIESAGSQPGARVHTLAVEVLKEEGIDISAYRPKSILDVSAMYSEPFLDENCLVIRLCAEEQCPLVDSNIEVLDWNLPDPASPEPLDQVVQVDRLIAFRDIRNEIKRRINLLGEFF